MSASFEQLRGFLRTHLVPVSPESGRPALVLDLQFEPWVSSREWLCQHLPPATGADLRPEHLLEPVEKLGAEVAPCGVERVVVSVEPSLELDPFLAAVRGALAVQCPGVSLPEDNAAPIFDVIVVTSLLQVPDWRLGLARCLNLLRPGGRVLFPSLNRDGLLLDGRVACWLQWNAEEHPQREPAGVTGIGRSTPWADAMVELYQWIEADCNRPWIPELSLTQPTVLAELLTALGEKPQQTELRTALLPYNPVTPETEPVGRILTPLLSNYSPPEVTRGPGVRLPWIAPVFSYLSGVELQRLNARFKQLAAHDSLRHRDSAEIDLGCTWHAAIFANPEAGGAKAGGPGPGHPTRDVYSEALFSYLSENRTLLDSSHHMLPEFNPQSIQKRELERKMLRTIRGFVNRQVQHDRFDPEYHHHFIASLWEPQGDDPTQGRFASAAGLIFRCDGRGEDARLDAALRVIAYLAHARWNNRITLQSIPQMLFDTDRPVMEITQGKAWAINIQGPEKLDQMGTNNPAGAARMPAHISIQIPQLDADGSGWREFRKRFIQPILQLPMPEYDESSVTLQDSLLAEMWELRRDRLHSLPWNVSREAELLRNPPSFDGAQRGEAAGAVTLQLATVLGNGQRNFLLEYLGITGPVQQHPSYRAFLDEWRRLMTRLNIPEERRDCFEEHLEQLFAAFTALTLAFPASPDAETGQWRLTQTPVGAFLDEAKGRFVAAGTSVLVHRISKNTLPDTQDKLDRNHDSYLSGRLSQIRTRQLIRQVPSALLPLSVLNFVHLFQQKAADAENYALSAATAHAFKVPLDIVLTKLEGLQSADPERKDALAVQAHQILFRRVGFAHITRFWQEQNRSPCQYRLVHAREFPDAICDPARFAIFSKSMLVAAIQIAAQYVVIEPKTPATRAMARLLRDRGSAADQITQWECDGEIYLLCRIVEHWTGRLPRQVKTGEGAGALFIALIDELLVNALRHVGGDTPSLHVLTRQVNVVNRYSAIELTVSNSCHADDTDDPTQKPIESLMDARTRLASQEALLGLRTIIMAPRIYGWPDPEPHCTGVAPRYQHFSIHIPLFERSAE